MKVKYSLIETFRLSWNRNISYNVISLQLSRIPNFRKIRQMHLCTFANEKTELNVILY